METAEKTVESIEQGDAVPMSPSTSLLDRLRKIQDAWLSYNVLDAEITYALEDGGDTDVTRSQVNQSWEIVNNLIMSNAKHEGQDEV